MSASFRKSELPTRRQILAGTFSASALALVTAAAEPAVRQLPEADCPRCGGLGRLPLKDAKPWVWVKGTAPPKWEAAVGEQFCPLCQMESDASSLSGELKEQWDDALENNRQWEQRTGWKLACVVTRHATVHTQLAAAQAKAVGTALETLTLQLKRITSSLLLATTRPDTLELVLLLEKPSWEAFRKIMEGLYTPQQLGESWTSAKLLNAYDHRATPHLYETQQTLRLRPPACGATFIVARRQLNRATDWRGPFWLTEGFAAYGDYVVHKVNRWFTVYSVKQVPVGDWLAEARKLVAVAQDRPWSEMFQRELRDWEAADHVQTMAMTAFLLEAEPAKFLDYSRRLKSGADPIVALEEGYGGKLGDLEHRWKRWLLARR
jgi:hypothetical protein